MALDDSDATVEIQYFDGTISELELESWIEVGSEPAQAPEDWSGSVDVDQEDLPDPDEGCQQSWQDPLEYLDHADY